MQTEEKRENIEEKKEERMEMPVSGALEREPGKAPVSGAEISVHDTENGHPSEDVYILAIESSCDETAASVVKNGRTVLSNIISSQIDLHTLFGGVVPEIASRKHIEKINQVIEEALTEAHMSLEEMTAIAVTYGPGLVGHLNKLLTTFCLQQEGRVSFSKFIFRKKVKNPQSRILVCYLAPSVCFRI